MHESYNERMVRSGQAVRDYESEKARRLRENREWFLGRRDSEAPRVGDMSNRAYWFWLLAFAALLLAVGLALLGQEAQAAPPEQISGYCCDCEEPQDEEATAARVAEYLERCRRRHELRQAELLGRWIALATSEQVRTAKISRADEQQSAAKPLGAAEGTTPPRPGHLLARRCRPTVLSDRRCEPKLEQDSRATDFALRDFIAERTRAKYSRLSLEDCEAFADACCSFEQPLWWCCRGWAESSANTEARGSLVWWTENGRRRSGRCTGWWQIHPLHIPRMKKLGLDYESEAHRTEFAKILAEDRGDRPWSESNRSARRFLKQLQREWEKASAGEKP